MPNPNIPVDVLIKDAGWTTVIDGVDEFCRGVIDSAIASHLPSRVGELSIALVSDAEIHALNKTYRGKDKPTNVLSFPDAGPAPLLGDIVIARETVMTEAKAAGLSMGDYLSHMLIHGFLHLQGYDHENDSDAVVMEALEVQALKALNIDNPYKMNEQE